MSATKHDYHLLEREFVEGDESIRALCRRHGVKSWSAVSSFAKKNAWEAKRAEFKHMLVVKQNEAVSTKMAEGRAEKVAKALDDALMVGNKALFTFLDSLEDRWVKNPETGKTHLIPAQVIDAGDFVKIFDRIMVLNGQPTKREAHTGLTLTGEIAPETAPVELLRDVISLARERGVESGPTGGDSPLPRIEGARKVN
jgi:hypothetical protein